MILKLANNELNENQLDNVLGGIPYEDALKMELKKLEQELINVDNSQKKSQIYVKMGKIQAELAELDNQKSNCRIR